MPLSTLPSAGLAIRARGGGGRLRSLTGRLRELSTPVIGRIEDDALWLDLRCLEDEASFLAVIGEMGGGIPE
jgi:L-seryl-tRNA(Ser) seleniumtransferase